MHTDELAARSYEHEPSIPSPMEARRNPFADADMKEATSTQGAPPQLSYQV
jgi:hypothetical protein